MREDIAGPQGASSRPMWETLEGMVREKAQEFIQQIMEEEVTELLGREKSERRSTVDSAEGYRSATRSRCFGLVHPSSSVVVNDSMIWVRVRLKRADGSSPGSSATSIAHDPLRPSSVAQRTVPSTVPLSWNMNSVEIDSSMLISSSGAPSRVKVIPLVSCLSIQPE